MAALEALVVQHRNSHVNLIQAMQDAEARHSQVCQLVNSDYLVKIFCMHHALWFCISTDD